MDINRPRAQDRNSGSNTATARNGAVSGLKDEASAAPSCWDICCAYCDDLVRGNKAASRLADNSFARHIVFPELARIGRVSCRLEDILPSLEPSQAQQEPT
jgi:hypothetical protein